MLLAFQCFSSKDLTNIKLTGKYKAHTVAKTILKKKKTLGLISPDLKTYSSSAQHYNDIKIDKSAEWNRKI